MRKSDPMPLLGVVQPPTLPDKRKNTIVTNFILFLNQIFWTPVFAILLALASILISIFTGLEGMPTILALSSASITLAILSISARLG